MTQLLIGPLIPAVRHNLVGMTAANDRQVHSLSFSPSMGMLAAAGGTGRHGWVEFLPFCSWWRYPRTKNLEETWGLFIKGVFLGGKRIHQFYPVYSILSEECLDNSRTQHGLAILPNWRLYGSNFSLFNKTGIAANGWKRGHVITCIKVVLYIFFVGAGQGIIHSEGNVNCDLKLTL